MLFTNNVGLGIQSEKGLQVCHQNEVLSNSLTLLMHDLLVYKLDFNAQSSPKIKTVALGYWWHP